MSFLKKPSSPREFVSNPTKLSPEILAAFNRASETSAVREAEIAANPELKPAPVVRNRPKKYTKKVLKTGMKVGDLILRGKGTPNKGAKPSLRERWRVECSCGTKLTVPKYYLIRRPNPKTHCGCQAQTLKSINAREFRIYHMMHQRTMNPKHIAYKHYHARGITIYEPWQKHNPNGFELWFAEVGPAPSPTHTLDRIDNNMGYFPNNLKWSTPTEQRANQGDLIGGYTAAAIDEMGLTIEEFKLHLRKGTLQEYLDTLEDQDTDLIEE